ncbi:MAG: LysR family transcriptional regulator, partial [Oscillospiraceae bacterium]
MLDIKLYSLLKVSETGSFTKAAQFLSLTQPAVSQQVMALEQSLGVALLLRTTRSVTLTEPG